jgi:hypothetical protein
MKGVAPMRQILASLRKVASSDNSVEKIRSRTLATSMKALMTSTRDKFKAYDQRATLAIFGFGAT